MLESDILKIKLSKMREHLITQTDMGGHNANAKIAALTKEVKDTEQALQKAIEDEAVEQQKLDAAAPAVNGLQPVDPELEALKGRVSVGIYLKAALEGQRLESGSPEEELRQHVKAPERSIPLDAFEVMKADAPTVPAEGMTGLNLQPMVPAVFARSVAARIGVSMPRAASGQRSIPRLTTNQTAGPKAKGDAQESTAGNFTVVSAKPRRVSARLTLQAEDLAEVGVPGFEAALRENLSMVLSDVVDKQILTGNGTAPNITGLLHQLTAASDPSSVIAFADFVALMGGQIDGLWASRLSDVRLLTNNTVYQKLVSSFQQPVFVDKGNGVNDASDAATPSIMSAADWGHDKLGDLHCSSRMPAPASNISKCLVMKAGSLITPAGQASMPAECATWGSIQVVDPYTSSAEATTHVTLHIMIADKVIIKQPAVYSEIRIKTA